jgi:hydroxyethylthiazole kinase-like uncharacterized protein yjeF
MKVLTANQVRALDHRAIEEFHISGMLLMESAALRVVSSIEAKFPLSKSWTDLRVSEYPAGSPYLGDREAVRTSEAGVARRVFRYPQADPCSIIIACGKGNNGGDGLAVARHLSARGYHPSVILTADRTTLTGDAAANYALLQAFPVPVLTATEHNLDDVKTQLSQAELIVDAIFGTGFKGPVHGLAEEVIKSINTSDAKVLAIDIPSGVNADTGEVTGECIKADWTVTFAAPKIGLLLFPGAKQAGDIEVVSIGMPRQILHDSSAQCSWLTSNIVQTWIPARTRDRDSNKGSYGHVALFAGGHGYLGAAQIAAEAAARIGSGLVTLATSEDALTALQTRLNPVIMTRALPSTDKGTIALSSLNDALEFGAKCKTAAIGPGLAIARSEETAEFARSFIRDFPFPLVIDADAIVALSQSPDRGESICTNRTAPTILTPHPGEMAKLLGTDTKTVQADRPAAVLQAAKAYNAVVVLKGDRSLIASPDGTWYINSTGNPGMATGGSGDALTGVIAGLLAQGLPALEAAAGGVYLHGLAGDCAAKNRGAREGLIATDLIESLAAAYATMRTCTPASDNDEGVIPWEN